MSRLVPRYCEPLEDPIKAATVAVNEISNVLNNTVRELAIILKEIKLKAGNDHSIMKMKDTIKSTGKILLEILVYFHCVY